MGGKEEFTWQVPSCLPYLKDQAHPLGITSTALADCVIQPPQGHGVPPPSSVAQCFIQDRKRRRSQSLAECGSSPARQRPLRGTGSGEAAGRPPEAGQGNTWSRRHTVFRDSEKACFTPQDVRKMRLLKNSSTQG